MRTESRHDPSSTVRQRRRRFTPDRTRGGAGADTRTPLSPRHPAAARCDQLAGAAQTDRRLCRPDLRRRQAKRHADRAAVEIRARDQPEDREGARPRAVADAAAACRGDRVRRRCIAIGLFGLVALPTSALPQQASPRGLRRVGILAPSTREREEVTLRPFFDQMKALGWIEGQTVAYDRAYADDQHAEMPRLAAELVARVPEVIYAPPAPAAGVAQAATKTIPIVFGTSVDPIGSGLVATLARPGGNVTGISSIADSLAPKRVQMLREIQPKAQRIGLLGD